MEEQKQVKKTFFSMFPHRSPRSPLVSPHNPWEKGKRPVRLVCVITRKRMLFALRTPLPFALSVLHGQFKKILARLLQPRTPKEKGAAFWSRWLKESTAAKRLAGLSLFYPADGLYRTGNPVVRGYQKGGSAIGIASGEKRSCHI